MKKPPSTSRPPVGNDNQSEFSEAQAAPTLWRDVIMGLRFFSRLPTGKLAHEMPQMGRLVPALGLTSVLIALPAILTFLAASFFGLPVLLAVCFGVVVQVVVTGAMAEDGLADSFDGLWGGSSPANRLEIMKDSTHGTYGVLALVLLILIRVFSLGALAAISPLMAALLWVAAQIGARQMALWLMLTLPLARQTGTAQSVGTLSKKAFGVGAVICALLFSVLSGAFVGIFGLIIAAVFMVLITALWQRICTNLVGGYSGDLIGGLQALLEFGALCAFILSM